MDVRHDSGFNADAGGRNVFDGVLPHVAGGGRMWMNYRFANLIIAAGTQYEDHYNRADHFPFSYAECADHLTGKTDAILKRPDTDLFRYSAARNPISLVKRPANRL